MRSHRQLVTLVTPLVQAGLEQEDIAARDAGEVHADVALVPAELRRLARAMSDVLLVANPRSHNAFSKLPCFSICSVLVSVVKHRQDLFHAVVVAEVLIAAVDQHRRLAPEGPGESDVLFYRPKARGLRPNARKAAAPASNLSAAPPCRPRPAVSRNTDWASPQSTPRPPRNRRSPSSTDVAREPESSARLRQAAPGSSPPAPGEEYPERNIALLPLTHIAMTPSAVSSTRGACGQCCALSHTHTRNAQHKA